MAFSSLGRRQPSKNIGILATSQSDISISPFEEGAAFRAENGNIGAFPGPSRGLPVLNGLKLLTQSLTKEAADSLHPVYNRVVSIDIARGATVGLMIFVNHAGDQPGWLHHAEWEGLHLADVVMPCFLLLVGLSAALSLSSQRARGVGRLTLLLRVLKRAGRMALLGLLIQGGAATQAFPGWDLARLRYFGVLQRIAVCFLLASAVAIYLPESRPPRAQEWLEDEELPASWALLAPFRFNAFWWSFALAVFAVFTGMSLLLVPPGCMERPALTPACNVAAWMDQRLLGPQHLYPFPSCRSAQPPCPYLDPEGLFTTLGGASVSTFIGLWFGTVLLTLRTHRSRLQAWATAAALLVELGYALALTGVVPINKNLYSASYVLVTAGISGAFLCLVYLLTDVLHSKLCAQLAQPFLWLGLNAVLVYAGDEVLERALPWVYWGSKDAHLLAWVQARFVAALGPGWRSNLALALADVAFWTAVAGYMHRKRWYVKV